MRILTRDKELAISERKHGTLHTSTLEFVDPHSNEVGPIPTDSNVPNR